MSGASCADTDMTKRTGAFRDYATAPNKATSQMCAFHTLTYDRLYLRPFPSFERTRQTVQVLFHMYYTNRQTYAYHILR